MPRVLITAFEPYDGWPTNASWLTVVELTRELPSVAEITTRLYPVDFDEVRSRLESDLSANFDYAVHLGQAPGSAWIHLESVALNVRGEPGQRPGQYQPLVSDGPAAYVTSLPLANWVEHLRAAAIPASVSYHAGTYLCNAALYYSHHIAQRQRLKTRPVFLHLPLDPGQAAARKEELPSLSAHQSAAAIRVILNDLAGSGSPSNPTLASR